MRNKIETTKFILKIIYLVYSNNIFIFAPSNQPTMKITKEQILKFNKAANRQFDIDNNLFFPHKVHKSKKDYNRKREKKVVFDY